MHIEVVHTLENYSYIIALHRMISRQDKLQVIHSDDGSNFVGAKKE